METEKQDRTRCTTPCGVEVRRTAVAVDGAAAIEAIARALDERLGGILASGMEVPGRHARRDLGFVDPPLVVEARDRRCVLRALNARGLALLPVLAEVVGSTPEIATHRLYCDRIVCELHARTEDLTEEERLRAPSPFSLLRAIVGALALPEGELLGLYGVFGYDLVFGLEDLVRRMPRDASQRDLVLFLADDVIHVDHASGRAMRFTYELVRGPISTVGLPRTPIDAPRVARAARAPTEPDDEAFRRGVRAAKEAFARGDLFEVVLSQTFERATDEPGSVLFARLRERNVAPYGFYFSLGEGERLIGASPEMFVRVAGGRVETCPIAGTIARDGDPLVDADRIRALLASEKDEAELTMCTDVDRNDKARVCVPGSVRVIARRTIEVYARVIHTVDHVVGTLRPDADAIDAMVAHAWAVTLTGAPKPDAMQFIEDHEAEPRGYYGGAIGMVGFDGRADTGITLRTIHLRDGLARVRAGATLLHASDEHEEELESRAKASALLDVLDRPRSTEGHRIASVATSARTVLLVDHRDSFVHTLGDYLRRTGARVVTRRAGFPVEHLDALAPDLAVLSPGPGSPRELGLSRTIAALLERGIPIFGVCLGLQGIVEHFGGELDRLATPAHGRATTVRREGTTSRLLDGLPAEFRAGRYHSLHARESSMPDCLAVTARSSDGVVMAIEHRALPVFGVQFHPESILTKTEVGERILANVLAARDQGAFSNRTTSSTMGISTAR